ncbi:MAG: thiamine diphosphokinase [Desulfomonilia bacterium]
MFLIVSGGNPPGIDLLHRKSREADVIIAADRGAHYCLEAGIYPHLLVGDMDSLSRHELKEIADRGIEIRSFPTAKDKTDTQIALEEAIRRHATSIEIVAATGGRFDHALANVHLLVRALQTGIPARIVDNRQEIFLLAGESVLEGKRGMTISLLPLTRTVKRVSLEGFAYELSDAEMHIGNPYGVSNIITSEKACVSIGEGIIVAVLMTEDVSSGAPVGGERD